MGKGRRLAYLGGAGVATGVLLAGAPSANAGPDDELIWEEGAVTSIADGDTITADLIAGPGALGSRRVRTVGVQAPEVAHNGTAAECGADQSADRLRSQLPVGAPVQARAVSVASQDAYSNGRIVRSLYAQDEEGNWYDTSRSTMSEGWFMWFPLAADSVNKPEWAHNLEYRVLADDAAGQNRGLWSANLCGAWPSANLRVWAFYTQNGVGKPERAFLENTGPDVDLGNWTLRDSALNYFRIPFGTVLPSGGILEVQFNVPGSPQPAWPGSTMVVYADRWDSGGPLGLNNLPATNAYFEGDALYVMDASGPFSTGNLRSWFPYPCNPDNCGDVLQGAVSISTVQTASPALRKPSQPGSVAATATTTADPNSATGGSAVVTWAAPRDFGGPGVTYTVRAIPTNGGPAPADLTGVTGLTATFPGLAVGRAYQFSVVAVNSANPSLVSDPSAPSGAVTPVGVPGTPANVTVESRSASSVLVSWTAPANDGGKPALTYSVAAVEDATKSCTTGPGSTAGVTSCLVTGLAAQPYSFKVKASNSLGTGAESTPSAPITPAAYVETGTAAPGKPTGVVARPGQAQAVVSWVKPAIDGGKQIVSYTATTGGPSPKSCTASVAGGSFATSCVVTGLTNGSAYTFTVRANNGSEGPASDTSASVAPFAYVDDQGPDTGSAPPAAESWMGEQFVELFNSGGAPAKLGGYGFWDKDSAGGDTDNEAYLFPANQVINPGQTLRVHFGPPTSAQPPAGTTLLEGGPELLNPADDYLELANLNRAQIACKAFGAATCRGTAQVSAPTPPIGITARTTSTTVSVAWGMPISRGGSPITGYTATAFNAPVGGDVIGSCGGNGGDRTCSFPAAVGTKYHVEVVAHNAVGSSAPSWRVLGTPKTVPNAPGGVVATGSLGAVDAAWTPGGDGGAPITSYTARAYAAGTGGAALGSCTAAAGATACTIPGLMNGLTYFVDVTATNRVGASAPSSPRVAATTLGAKPAAVTTYSKKKVTVRWDPPQPGSAPVTSYSAKVFTKAAGGKLVASCSAVATKGKCTTKKTKKTYKRLWVELTAIGPAGASTITPRIETGVAKKATPPTSVAATSAANRVTVTWGAPVFNGYSYLKTYSARLYTKAKGGSVKAKCSVKVGSSLSCTTKALKKGKVYYATVAVKNSKGWSKYAKPRFRIVVS